MSRPTPVLHVLLAVILLMIGLRVLPGAPPILAQDDGTVTPDPAATPQTETPVQLDLVLAALSQGIRENVTLDSLSRYEWSREQFPDTSLGCPDPGQMYAQVITPGYQFLLSYAGTTYDYRVSDDGTSIFLCDTRPTVTDPEQPATGTITPPAASPCGGQYIVQTGDNLAQIAELCNLTLEALLAANPTITDPSLIYVGQVLNLPESSGSGQRLVVLDPPSGPPGSLVQVSASGFPAGAQVQVGFGPPESEYRVVANREISAGGLLMTSLRIPTTIQPPAELVAVVVLNGVETISGVFTVTEGQATPEPTATTSPDGTVDRTQLYLVALEDEGRSGEPVGCGDSLVPVTVDIPPTDAPLTAALNALFAIDTRIYEQSGLYNALYQSELTLESMDLTAGTATINLTGTLQTGGVCDDPRLRGQIEQTALQYATVEQVVINVNGAPLGSGEQ